MLSVILHNPEMKWHTCQQFESYFIFLEQYR